MSFSRSADVHADRRAAIERRGQWLCPIALGHDAALSTVRALANHRCLLKLPAGDSRPISEYATCVNSLRCLCQKRRSRCGSRRPQRRHSVSPGYSIRSRWPARAGAVKEKAECLVLYGEGFHGEAIGASWIRPATSRTDRGASRWAWLTWLAGRCSLGRRPTGRPGSPSRRPGGSGR